jgi:hypothetical protein
MRSISSFDHRSLVDDAHRRDGDDHDIVIHDLADFDRLYGPDGEDSSDGESRDSTGRPV